MSAQPATTQPASLRDPDYLPRPPASPHGDGPNLFDLLGAEPVPATRKTPNLAAAVFAAHARTDHGDYEVAVIRVNADGTVTERQWRYQPGVQAEVEAGVELAGLLDGAPLVYAADDTPMVLLNAIQVAGRWGHDIAIWPVGGPPFDLSSAAAALLRRRPPYAPIEVLRSLLASTGRYVRPPANPAEEARLLEVAYDVVFTSPRER